MRTFRNRAALVTIGLAVVGLTLGWTVIHPSLPMLELAEGPTYLCGSTHRGSYDRHLWIIRNAGTIPLRIRTRFTSGRSGFSLWQHKEHVVLPGLQIMVHLTWVAPGRSSVPFRSYVILWTNDPEWPEIRLSVVGISSDENLSVAPGLREP